VIKTLKNALPLALLALLYACNTSTAANTPIPSVAIVADVSTIANDGSLANVTATCRDAAGNAGTGSIIFTAPYGNVNGTGTVTATATLNASGIAKVSYACNAATDSRCISGKVVVTATWGVAANYQSLTLSGPGGATDGGTPPPADGGTSGDGGIPPHVLGPPASIIFVSATPYVLGLRGSGIQEQGLMSFLVVDSYGAPVPSTLVNFTQAQPALVTLGHTSGTTDTTGTVWVDYAASGEVGTSLITATVGGTTIATSHVVAVRGAKPSAAGFYFRCAVANIPIYTITTGLITTTCTVRLSDRYGNRVGVATPVQFASEAGAITASAMTKPFDYKNPTDPDEGSVSVTFTADVANGFTPADVAPLAAAPAQYPIPRLAAEPSRTVGTFVYNPRDQLVTIIAMVRGEEAFVDANHNGVYDLGELFVDQGDPYVDANDNNVYDALTEQRFCGGATCATYNGPNGIWDADRTIWAPTWVVFTGVPFAQASSTPPMPGSLCLDYSNNSVGNASIMSFSFAVVDRWLNTGALGTSYTASVTGAHPPALSTSGNFNELDAWGSMGLLHLDFDWVRLAASDFTKACGDPTVAPICIQRLVFGDFDTGGRIGTTLSNAALLPKGGTTGNGCAPPAPSAGTQTAPFSLFVTATTNSSVSNVRVTPSTAAAAF
jgi:hypothetical protein